MTDRDRIPDEDRDLGETRNPDETRNLDETRNRDDVRDLDERLGTVDGIDAGSGFSLDCEFCEETLHAETVAGIKERGVAHLEADHYGDLVASFAERSAGDGCRNGCGYVFPADVEAVAGFDCPECGHDHFRAFARRYLYWEIEVSG